MAGCVPHCLPHEHAPSRLNLPFVGEERATRFSTHSAEVDSRHSRASA
jgi:hypothetical protein